LNAVIFCGSTKAPIFWVEAGYAKTMFLSHISWTVYYIRMVVERDRSSTVPTLSGCQVFCNSLDGRVDCRVVRYVLGWF
jgi:hypothetical protein